MKNAFRDCDIRFSAKDGGIWLRDGAHPRLLPLKDCLSDMGKGDASSRCVGSRDITKLTFTLSSNPPTEITFSKGLRAYIRTRKTAAKRFHLFQKAIQSSGFTTFDLS